MQATEKTLNAGIQANPESVLLHMALAGFYGKTSRLDEALATLEKVIELEPDNIRHKFNLAGLLWDADRKEEASDLLEGIIASDPDNEDKSWYCLWR